MHRSECSKRIEALDDRNISFVISQDCKRSRTISNGSYKCKGNCADLFPTVSDAFKAVKKIRQAIWIDPASLSFDFSMHNASGLDVRKSAFIKAIVNMSNTDESGKNVITFCTDAIAVCKNFYFRATGLNRKLFNRGIAFVSWKEDDEQDQKVLNTLTEKKFYTYLWIFTYFSTSGYKIKWMCEK